MRTYHDVEVAGGERPWDATRSVRLTAVDRRARHICMRRESCCACSPYCAVLATGRANRSIAGIAGLPLITPPKVRTGTIGSPLALYSLSARTDRAGRQPTSVARSY
jgi:hypothetical protein